jgi:hypothetical protein
MTDAAESYQDDLADISEDALPASMRPALRSHRSKVGVAIEELARVSSAVATRTPESLVNKVESGQDLSAAYDLLTADARLDAARRSADKMIASMDASVLALLDAAEAEGIIDWIDREQGTFEWQ